MRLVRGEKGQCHHSPMNGPLLRSRAAWRCEWCWATGNLTAPRRSTASVTSANLTEAALERNMELGVLIRGGHLPAAIRPPDRRAPEMWRNAGGLVLGCVHRNYQPHCVGPFNHPYSPVRSRRRDLQLQAGIETAYRCVENPAISKIIRSARLTRVALQLQPNAKPPESRALSKLGGRHRASGHAPEC